VASDSVARVPTFLGRVLDERGQPGGTCFQVAPGVLVTAWHVLNDVGDAAPGAVTRVDPLAGGRWFAAVVELVNEQLDLAVLRGDIPLAGSVPGLVPTDMVGLRTELEITGVSRVRDRHDYRFMTTTGSWQGPVIRDERVPLGRLRADSILPGMSGAPVLRAGDQMVIGVLSGRYNSTDGWLEHTGWVTRTEALIAMLEGIAAPRIECAPQMPSSNVQASSGELIVSPNETAAFSKISDAIAAARPWQRITVLPGMYREHINLETPVTIVGKGRRSEIILISNSGPCITAGCSGLVQGISLRLAESERSRNDWRSTVRLVSGEFKLSDCEITGGKSSAVQVEDGEMTIEDCRVCGTGSQGRGLLVFGGTVKAQKCEFIRCDIGTEIQCGTCELTSCKFINYRTGVYLAEHGARGTLIDCVINGGQWGACIGHGHIAMRRCKVKDNHRNGVIIYESATGEFAGNDFSENFEDDFYSKAPRRAIRLSGNTGNVVWEHSS